jgi:hypothetical protein
MDVQCLRAELGLARCREMCTASSASVRCVSHVIRTRTSRSVQRVCKHVCPCAGVAVHVQVPMNVQCPRAECGLARCRQLCTAASASVRHIRVRRSLEHVMRRYAWLRAPDVSTALCGGVQCRRRVRLRGEPSAWPTATGHACRRGGAEVLAAYQIRLQFRIQFDTVSCSYKFDRVTSSHHSQFQF